MMTGLVGFTFDPAQTMNQAIIDTLEAVLDGRLVAPENVHDGLLACLDLAEADDADANELRFILEKMSLPAAFDEFRWTLSQIRNHRLRR
jgi:hypothetical protein